MPSHLSPARNPPRKSVLAVDADAVELHPVVDEAVAELLGDPPLQLLQLLVDELDHIAGLDVDQMVVVGRVGRFVAGAAVAEIVAVENPRSSNRRTVRYTVAIEIFGSIAAARACSASTSG